MLQKLSYLGSKGVGEKGLGSAPLPFLSAAVLHPPVVWRTTCSVTEMLLIHVFIQCLLAWKATVETDLTFLRG